MILFPGYGDLNLTGSFHAVKFQNVTDLEIVKILYADAALIAGGNLPDIILKALKAIYRGVGQHLLAPPDPDGGAAVNFAFVDHDAGYFDPFAGGENGLDSSAGVNDLDISGLKHTFKGLFDIVNEGVNDIVIPYRDTGGRREVTGALGRRDVEPDDYTCNCSAQASDVSSKENKSLCFLK